LFAAAFSSAQDDPGMQAMQAAQQAAIQANQQAMENTQRANQEANDQMIREMPAWSADASQNNGSVIGPTAKPKISVKSGKYHGPITVKLSDSSRGAVMYYRSDGWTPTNRSTRYTGPITINSSATLQVIAVAPYCLRSLVATATYTLPAPRAPLANPQSSSAL
jgi:Chitobiase/beta-hexosaminidase C-terminal domain